MVVRMRDGRGSARVGCGVGIRGRYYFDATRIERILDRFETFSIAVKNRS